MIFKKNKPEKEEEYKDDENQNFITLEEEPYFVIRFLTITEEMKIKDIIAEIKKGNVMILVDVSAIMDDPATLRIFVNKIRRIADEHTITMKLYGGNWLLILPSIALFQVGDE